VREFGEMDGMSSVTVVTQGCTCPTHGILHSESQNQILLHGTVVGDCLRSQLFGMLCDRKMSR
jgi:hypothetical protein